MTRDALTSDLLTFEVQAASNLFKKLALSRNKTSVMLWNYKKYCIIDHGSDTLTKPDFLLLDAVPHFAFSVVSISLTVCAVNVPNKLV